MKIKYLSVFIGILSLSVTVMGQIPDPADLLKEKAENRASEKVDEAAGDAVDKVEEGVMSLFKNKKKNNEEKKNAGQESENKQDSGSNSLGISKAGSDKNSFKSFSKFDFIPGEKVIFFENFAQDAVGDFPALWTTNGSGEVVTTSAYPGKWLMLKGGDMSFMPEVSIPFTENFTVEFNLIYTDQERANENFYISFIKSGDGFKVGDHADNSVDINLSRTSVSASSISNGDNYFSSGEKEYDLVSTAGKQIRVSIWMQKQRVRLYINEAKLLDLPRIAPKGMTFDKLVFESGNEDQVTLINDVRVAVGLPDTRSKLIKEGKLVTHGITFDSGSDKIKPESYGVLKEIADVLKQNGDVKVKIIGHTDSDGDEAMNLKLSQKRSLAIKNSLVSDFGIAASRMETDGKGESQPIASNDTAEGKANNRRVEFIKL